MGDAVNLDEIAEQELLNEAKRGAARASVYGALGWQKCPLKPTNKIFLQNILLSTISSKRREIDSSTQKDVMKRKLEDFVVRHSGGIKRDPVSEKKSVLEEGQKVHDSPDSNELSRCGRESDDQMRTSSKKKHRDNYSSVSVIDTQQFKKHKHKYHNKQVISAKHSNVDSTCTKK